MKIQPYARLDKFPNNRQPGAMRLFKAFTKILGRVSLVGGLTLVWIGLSLPLQAQNPATISYQSLYGTAPENPQSGALTARAKAFELAKILDQGRFQGELIRSVHVLNYTDFDYYIVATLGNGSSVKLYMDLIKKASKQNQLVLQDNRLLVFKTEALNDFQVFDKNAFYSQALQAKYFRRTFPRFHPLENLSFLYSIKDFQYNAATNAPFVFEFINGGKVALDNQQAFTALDTNQLVNTTANLQSPLMDMPLYLERVSNFDKIPYGIPPDDTPEVKKFGLQLSFYQPLPNHISEKYFPVLLEKSQGNFYINLVVPNVSLVPSFDLAKTGEIEYLQKWEFLKNSTDRFGVFRNRLLSQNFAESVFLSNPPKVYIHPDRKNVFITFYQTLDQTLNYKDIAAADKILLSAKVRKTGKLPIYSKNYHTEFIKSYNKGIELYNQGLVVEGFANQKTTFQKAIDMFRLAGHYSKSDKDLALVLEALDFSRQQIWRDVYQGNLAPYIEARNFADNVKNETLFQDIAQYAPSKDNPDLIVSNVRSLFEIEKKIRFLNMASVRGDLIAPEDKQEYDKIVVSIRSTLQRISSSLPAIRKLKLQLLTELQSTQQKIESKRELTER